MPICSRVIFMVELLAPAKNLKSIKAGLKFADSFYFGFEKYNMRMQADNFTQQDLPKAVKLLHDNSKRAFLTTNILFYEEELGELRELLELAHTSEFDAVILHDIAAISYAKEIGIPFHISTQANISNSVSAKFFEDLGAERVILAREVSLKHISTIAKRLTKTEIEVFVHGAMCTSISGRCYLSQDVCGGDDKFSANRGRCIQPCRRDWTVIDNQNNEYIYDGVRFMNSRDLCLIEYLPELIDSGVKALKIEGRMRDPHYVHWVTKIYREALKAQGKGEFTTSKKKKVGMWINELKKVYNRGFTQGFLFNRMQSSEHQYKSPTNLSHWRLIKLGTITSYSNSIGTVELTNGFIKEKTQLIVQGNSESDTYFPQQVRQLMVGNQSVQITPKGSESKPVKFSMKFDEPVVPLKDCIYLFTDSTYKHRKPTKGKKSSTPKKKKDYYKL
ncbi:MAG: U32 family peptidase [Promethearchaeota archaeon]|nr:MAG: U32 family peptidase [Candidatus Lokiarchaeota archaeon]